MSRARRLLGLIILLGGVSFAMLRLTVADDCLALAHDFCLAACFAARRQRAAAGMAMELEIDCCAPTARKPLSSAPDAVSQNGYG